MAGALPGLAPCEGVARGAVTSGNRNARRVPLRGGCWRKERKSPRLPLKPTKPLTPSPSIPYIPLAIAKRTSSVGIQQSEIDNRLGAISSVG